jgi:hypothetical protein
VIADPDRFVAGLLGAYRRPRDLVGRGADLRQVKSDFRNLSPADFSQLVTGSAL